MVDEVAIQKYVGRFSALSALAARALREKAGDAPALFGAAGLFRQAGDLTGALRALDAAIALDAQQASFWFERGQTLRFLGRLQQAAAAYARALDVDPDYYRARYALVQLQPQTAESLSALEAHMEGADEEGWRSLHIGHALAKACEDLGELERSFNWLARAKQRRAGLWAYDAAAEEALVEAALSHAPPAERAPPAGPIFVVGLPRSGTTLVDRIISSHPEVTSAGELANFAILYNMLAGAPMPSVHSAEALRASGVDHTRLGRLYLESARPRCGARCAR